MLLHYTVYNENNVRAGTITATEPLSNKQLIAKAKEQFKHIVRPMIEPPPAVNNLYYTGQMQ